MMWKIRLLMTVLMVSIVNILTPIYSHLRKLILLSDPGTSTRPSRNRTLPAKFKDDEERTS